MEGSGGGEELEHPILVRAIAPNKTRGQLEFKKGQEMTVERVDHDASMYFGFYAKKEGWFPDYFVQTVPNGKPELRKKAPAPAPKAKPAAPAKPAPSAAPTTPVSTAAPARPTKRDKKHEAKEKKEETARAKRAQLEQKKKMAKDRKAGSKRGGGGTGTVTTGTAPMGDDVAIPNIIETTIAFLEDPERLKLEGIFRVSGSLNDVKLIKESYEKGKKVDLTKVADAHTVAGVLKIFFRESKDPLLTFELYDCWVAAIATPSEGDRVASVKQVIELLPQINRRILQRLIGLLVKVAEYEQYNKMSVNNIAIVFAPTLLRPPGDRIDIAIQDSSYANHLIKFIIEEYETLFFDKPVVPKRPSIPTPVQHSEELPAIQQTVSEEEFDKRLRRGSLMIAKGSMMRGQQSSFVTAPPYMQQQHHQQYQEEDEDTSDVSVDGAESEGEDTNPSDNEGEPDAPNFHANMTMGEMMDQILEGHVQQVDDYLATLDPEYAAATKKDLLERIDALMQSDDFRE